MIIECPNCNTKFELELNAPPFGKKMKCSECAYAWIYLPEESDEPPASLQSIITPTEVKIEKKEQPVAMPTVKLKAHIPIIASIVVFLLCCSTLLGFNYARGHNAFWGLLSTDNFKVLSVECKEASIESSNNSNSEIELWIKVDVFNSSNSLEVLKKMRLAVYDKDNNFLDELVMDIGKEVSPNSSELIEGRLNRIPANAMFIVVDIGNSSQIILRDRSILSKI